MTPHEHFDDREGCDLMRVGGHGLNLVSVKDEVEGLPHLMPLPLGS